MKELDVWQVIVWCSAAERLPLYSFPHRFLKQIHFLSVLHDAIQQTGNNISLFFPSVILSAICLSPHVGFCVLIFVGPSSRCALFLPIIMTCPSATDEFSFLLLVEITSPPAGHFCPTYFDPIAAHSNSVKIWCFKAKSVVVAGSHCCTFDVQRIFFFFFFETIEADL